MDPLVTIEELMNRNYPEQEWLVDKLVPSGAITVLSGAPGSYKTWVTQHTAICIARGEPLFGKLKTTQGNVLVIDKENGGRLLQKMAFMLGATADLPIFFNKNQQFTLNDEDTELALQKCKEHDIKLVIIDSLVRVHKSDENSAGEMSRVFEYLRQFTRKGIAVLVIQHNRKPGTNGSTVGNEMRGSSDILASADCHIGVKRRHKTLTLYQGKNRYAEELNPFEVLTSCDDFTFTFEYQSEIQDEEDRSQVLKDTILVLLIESEKLFQKELLSKLEENGTKTNEHKLREMLKELLADGMIVEKQGHGKTKFYSLPEENSNE